MTKLIFLFLIVVAPLGLFAAEPKDLKAFGDFASEYNRFAGKVRVVAILSPT